MRQHIDIGLAPNDGTGDVPRIAWDKANDNFIELYTMFDDWPGNFDYWPLGGTADLTSSVTVDGNDYDLIFGSPNRLDDFSVYANNSILLDFDDGLNPATFTITSGETNLTIDGNLIVNSTQDMEFTFDDGGGNSSQLFIGVTGLVPTMSFSVFDGVDSSSLDLIPTLATLNVPLQLPSYTVAGLPSASPAGQIAYCSNESGGKIIIFADGTDWRRVTDGSIVS